MSADPKGGRPALAEEVAERFRRLGEMGLDEDDKNVYLMQLFGEICETLVVLAAEIDMLRSADGGPK